MKSRSLKQKNKSTKEEDSNAELEVKQLLDPLDDETSSEDEVDPKDQQLKLDNNSKSKVKNTDEPATGLF